MPPLNDKPRETSRDLVTANPAWAAAWQFQFTGVGTAYDPSQPSTALGNAESIAGNFPTLLDKASRVSLLARQQDIPYRAAVLFPKGETRVIERWNQGE